MNMAKNISLKTLFVHFIVLDIHTSILSNSSSDKRNQTFPKKGPDTLKPFCPTASTDMDYRSSFFLVLRISHNSMKFLRLFGL